MILVRLWYDKHSPEIEIHEGKLPKRISIYELSNRYISKENYCIGYLERERVYNPCGKRLIKGFRCKDCENKDWWIACAKCNGTRCINTHKEAKEICFKEEFYVYLAYFGGNIVKVGVSSKERLKIRLLEQGAIAYKIYTEAENGFEARKIESKLKNKFPDRLTYKQKVNLYRKLDLDWFDKMYGMDGILEYNYENIKLLENKSELKNLEYIPKVVGAIGQIIITDKGYFSFGKIRGKKLVNKKSILDYF